MTEPIVYVVTKSWQWDGSEVTGAFLSLEAARKHANKTVELDRHCHVDITAWVDDNALTMHIGF